jgi:hypothetical protein
MKHYLLIALAAGIISFYAARQTSFRSADHQPLLPAAAQSASALGRNGGEIQQSGKESAHSSVLAKPPKNATNPFKDGIGICAGFQADDVAPALMSQSPFPDQASWREFLNASGAAFDSLRQNVLPVVLQRSSAVRECYLSSEVEGTAIAEIVLTIEATGNRAEVPRAEIRQLQGDPLSVAVARRCLSSAITAHLPLRIKNPGPLEWPTYKGVYPKILHLYFGQDVGLFTGATED